MERESGFNPEQHTEKRETKERQPIREFFGSFKKRIIDSLDEIVTEDDLVLEQFERQIEKSKSISEAAGEYFRSLIPKSATPPEQEYEHEERPSAPFMRDAKFLAELRKEREKRSLASFRKMRKRVFEERDQEGSGEYHREPIEHGYYERKTYTSAQEGGQNIIKEEVLNTVNEDIEANMPVSFVSVRNRETGATLDCSQLLPKEKYLGPEELMETDESYSSEANKFDVKPILKSLASYEGTEGSDGEFYMNPEVGVAYGDLTKPGGMVSLMHEIAHAWQVAYYKPYGRPNFESLITRIRASLDLLREVEDKVAGGEMSSDIAKAARIVVQEKLADEGVEFDPDAYYTEDDKPAPEGARKVRTLSGSGSYVVASEAIEKDLQGYIQQERDAWAHAIRAVRFLRKHGIDIEPQLKTLDDFREHVDKLLDTYQQSLDKNIETMSSRSERFLRLPNTKKAGG